MTPSLEDRKLHMNENLFLDIIEIIHYINGPHIITWGRILLRAGPRAPVPKGNWVPKASRSARAKGSPRLKGPQRPEAPMAHPRILWEPPLGHPMGNPPWDPMETHPGTLWSHFK